MDGKVELEQGDRELIAILLRQQEAKDLDYKAPMEWKEKDKGSCCSLTKDILAMANTQGGYIVIGVSEIAQGFSFDGLSDAQAKSFDTTRLNRFLQSYTDPPINARLRKLRYQGKIFVFIEVPVFPVTPHICQKDLPGVLLAPTIYVRTNNNESAPLRSAADFNSVIDRAVRNRSDALLASFRSILTSGKVPQEPSSRDSFLTQRDEALNAFASENPLSSKEPLAGYIECTFMPQHFELQRFSLDQLRAAAVSAQITYTGWPFLYIDETKPDCPHAIQDGWQMHLYVHDYGFGETLDFWRLQQSGLFFHRALLRPYASQADAPVADIQMIGVHLGQAVDCLTRLYSQLFEDTEYVAMLVRVVNAQGRRLVNAWGGMPLWNEYTCQIPEIAVEHRSPLAEWRAAIVDHAVALANEIYIRFNWQRPNLDLARQAIQRTFARQL